MRQLAHGRGRGYEDAVAIYADEASKLGIKSPTKPEPWELIYEDALAPKTIPAKGEDWTAIQHKLWTKWCVSHGLTPDDMVNNRNEFSFRHRVSDMASLARVNYKMEFKNIAPVWLADCLVDVPAAVNDLDQIQKLLAARPELVMVTPDDAAKVLGLKPDPRHRTLKAYCREAGLDVNKLTRVQLPLLQSARIMKKSSQGRNVARANQKRA
jgi:hypothetical protein